MTDERERLIVELDEMRTDHLVCAVLTSWSLERLESAHDMLRADAAEIAALHSRLEAAEKLADWVRRYIQCARKSHTYMPIDGVDTLLARYDWLASTPPPECVGQREEK